MKKSIIFLALCCILHVGSAALVDNFYKSTCSDAETIVRKVVEDHFKINNTIPAALLRMHFHDCFVKGCDASILIDSTPGSTSEKEAGPNLSVRGYDLIDDAKKKLEAACPTTVSCADIIALATRDAVALGGGPSYNVPTGRLDGRSSEAGDVNMPSPDQSVPEALKFFTDNGLDLSEMVALLGAHTVGITHCSFVKDRLSKPDGSMEPALASSLSKTCSGNGDLPIFLDQNTSFVVDNEFYNQLKKHKGVLKIDQNLETDKSSSPIVASFALNGNLFRESFVKALVKMGRIEGTDGEGEIRKDCRVINPTGLF